MGQNLNYTYLDCLAMFGVGGAHPGGLQVTKEFLVKEEISNTTSILDAGCGTGQTSAYLVERYGCHVTSLDNNKMMINKARQRFSFLQLPIEVMEGSIENLPFEDGTFDLIVAESVISFTNIPLTIAEMKRVLNQNGVLLALEMVLEASLSKAERESIVDFYGISQLLTEEEWVRFFHSSGFNEINVEKYAIQVNDHDDQNATDFSLSENIDDSLIEILEKHLHFTTLYKDKISFRLFRCRDILTDK